jgi:glutamyl-tRNA synthetase
MEELIQAFSIERIGKSGTKFDIQKARWFNQQYLKSKPDEELAGYLLEEVKNKGITVSPERAAKVCGLMKERVVFPKDFWYEGKFFFQEPERYDEVVVAQKWTSEAITIIGEFRDRLTKEKELNAERAKDILNEVLEKNQVKIGKVLQAMRLAVTGAGAGPDLMQIIELLGKDETIKRIDKAIEVLSNKVKA